MIFNVSIEGQFLTSSVQIIAALPPDVGNEPGDADFADVTGAMSGVTPISASLSTAILADARAMGEWTYTQNCAQCNGGPYTEPPVNIPAKFGDCTDFVWIAVKHVLGTSWPHAKISTRMFNNYSAAQLIAHGYTEVDSASVRAGDIVVRTKISGDSSGHAGVFTGWADGGYPIGHANNGLPATQNTERQDNDTGPFHFKQQAAKIVKFFRPVS